ncbi:O-antigen ligase family protein [Sphingobacterium sp. DN00404]|uniref:O-antigen ligase family protein n=1 Tax=Sphingobacterium micropteri TaxID=2763501 RepID=A0ABR7YNI6_9SPHI|nr:O-antigen ligase family protein [Sphingobacterium micropteri]MBD1432877.1 O-antigen ligase family protein [Sphingobacterium micropteri]
MIQQPRICWINYICLLPFIALLGNVLLADDWLTHTHIGKHIGFYIVMAFIPLATALSFWNNRAGVKFHLADYFIVIWLAISFGLSYLYLQTVNNKMAIFVMLGALYYCFRIFLAQTQINLRILMLAIMLLGCVEAVWGLLQLYGFARSQHALYGVTGSLFNPGPYAGFLAIILPVSLFYLLWDRQALAKHRHRKAAFFKVRWFTAMITCIVIVLVLPATMSRAAWLAATIGCATVFGGYYRCFLKPKRAKRSTIGRMIGIAAAFTAVMSLATAGIYYLKKDSADGRTLIWKLSADRMSKTWVGEGMGTFSGVYGGAQEAYFDSGAGVEREKWLAGEPEYAFNEFLQIGVEQGYLPLAFFILIIAFALVTGIRYRRFMADGGLMAILVFAFFSYPFSLMPFLIVFVFFLASCISLPYAFTYYLDFIKSSPIPYRVRRRWNAYTMIFALLLSTLYVAQSLYKRYPVYQAHQAWAQSQVYYQTGMYKRVVDLYKPLYPLLLDQPHFLFEYGRSLYMMGEYEESIDVLFKGVDISADPMFRILIGRNEQMKEDYLRAEGQYRFAANQVPNRLYPHYLLAKLYDEIGEYEKAYDIALEVVNKEVKVHSPAVEEMKAEMQKYIEQGKKESKLNKDDKKKKFVPALVY